MKSPLLLVSIGTIALLSPAYAKAESTTCANPTVIIPDGRLTSSSVPAGATFYFQISSRVGSTYSAEFHTVLDPAVQPVSLIVYSDPGCSTPISPTNTAGIDPGDQNGVRVSFAATTTVTRFALNNAAAGAITYSFGVSDTTMYSPAWSTNGTFDTFFSFLNTTSGTINGTVRLYNTAGTQVSASTVTISPNSTGSTNTVSLGTVRNSAGTAQFTHNGPPGAILAESAVANFTLATPYLQPVKFVPVRSGDAAVAGGIGAGAVGTAQLADGSVTGTKIAAGAAVKSLNGQTDAVTLAGANGLSTSAGAGSVTVTSNATPNNTAGAIVSRDGSGNFAAATIALGGNLSLPNTSASASAGVLTLGGVRFLHNWGTNNTFVGSAAGNTTMSGANNTAVGFNALLADTSGALNSAFGAFALSNNTVNYNSAFGDHALYANTTGVANSAFGTSALYNNTASSNSAFGTNALQFNTTGGPNSAFGTSALQSNTTAANNSAFGNGALFGNTTGASNSAFGNSALQSNTTGDGNSAFGDSALLTDTGSYNSAFGIFALRNNNTGVLNSAFGDYALVSNTTGGSNSALGSQALLSNSSGGFNSAFGANTLALLSSGDSNTAIGNASGSALTTGSNNIYIGNAGATTESKTIRIGTDGNQTAAFMAAIYGATSAGGVAVLVSSSGQLGTTTSSRRFKDEIADMGEESDVLMKLRPVAFYYKPEYDETRTRQYGLVAEEVSEVAPQLVVLDRQGAPQMVRSHFVNAMLLNEVQKQRRLLEEQRSLILDLESRLARLEAR